MSFDLNLNNIKYIKISYKNTENEISTIKAILKKIEKSEILACIKAEENLKLTTPQEITLNIVCSEGLYKATTILKKIEIDTPYNFLTKMRHF